MTVIVDVSPCFRLGRIQQQRAVGVGALGCNVADVIVSGLTGCECSPVAMLFITGIVAICPSVVVPGEQLAEDRIAVAELRVERAGVDEELGVVAVGAAAVGHRELIDAR